MCGAIPVTISNTTLQKTIDFEIPILAVDCFVVCLCLPLDYSKVGISVPVLQIKN